MDVCLLFFLSFCSSVSLAVGSKSANDCVPDFWKSQSLSSNMIISSEPPPSEFYPNIGNGYVGAVIKSDAVFVGGIYNGHASATPSHRARLPYPIDVYSPHYKPCAFGLDLKRAMFLRRFSLSSTNNSSFLESDVDESGGNRLRVEGSTSSTSSSSSSSSTQSTIATISSLAHRSHSSLMMVIVNLTRVDSSTSNLDPVRFPLAVNSTVQSDDIDFVSVDNPSCHNCNCFNGSTRLKETNASAPMIVSYCHTIVPSAVSLLPGEMHKELVLLMTVRTSLDSNYPLFDALLDLDSATAESSQVLVDRHVAAWDKLRNSRIEISGFISLKIINFPHFHSFLFIRMYFFHS